MPDDNAQKIDDLSNEIIKLAHDDILMHLRFFDLALWEISWKKSPGSRCVALQGKDCFYDPKTILQKYKEDNKWVGRTYLHILLHCIFFHSFQYDKLEKELWDLAADIAVENVIIEMNLPSVTLKSDADALRKLRILKEDAGELTAERIYRYFSHTPPSEREKEEYRQLFVKDSHVLWVPREEVMMTLEQWKKISERIKADLKSFTKAKTGAETLEKNLEEATRDRYDYSAILRRFMTMGEDMTVNDDEFDYVYYTYGLRTYGNLPLIEPLEYKEVHKVKEFVIAIDTSASCRGPVVQAFLKKTYSILKSTDQFFSKINVHIIQCDTEVQSDTKITNDEEFENFMKYGKLTGFGATDFRPVFTYVDELKKKGEFENLKGLIYFTDGYGIYPEQAPGYDVIFAFLEEDEMRAPVPYWSIKVVLETEDILKDGK